MTNFDPDEIKEIRGIAFGISVNYCCNGCGANFKNVQGLSSHKVQ